MDYSILSRSYDLRGIYPIDINEDFYRRLGYAFVAHTKVKKLALWYDARLSSESLKNAFIEGALFHDIAVVDIGLCSSDMLSFATCYYPDIEVWVMITASHNPKEYNGMKSVWHTGEPINLKKEGTNITQIMSWIDFESLSSLWNVEKRSVNQDWIHHILSFSETKNFSGLKVVCDAWNGAAWAFLSDLAEATGWDMIPLYLEPDGNFPNHHPSPIEAHNREDARLKLLEVGADIVLLFDGDADRCVILDNTGEMIISGIISVVIADSLLKKNPWKKICGNAVISKTLPDFVASKGSEYIKELVGHVYIKDRMAADQDIIYAGEHSSHYYLRDNWCQDSGIIAAIIFLDLLYQSGKKADEFTQEYKKYITLEETNFSVRDPKWAIAILSEQFKDFDMDLFDGITVRYDDGSWWNFRPSSNEPLLRLNMEALTQERFDSLYLEIRTIIDSFV